MNPNNKKYKYSIGILIFHRTPELVEIAKDCLASVLNTVNRDEVELILVDNGSTIRDKYFENNVDTYIRFNENKGISRGWNAILKNARGEHIVILGDDTIVMDDWLEQLNKAMDMPLCGLANVHMQHLPQGTGIVENYKWPSGACFMVTPQTIEKVGYFEEETYWPANFEDWSYWCKIYQSGLKMYRNYGITVLHREGQTVHAKDISSHFEQNKKRFIDKWGFDPVPVFCGDADIYDTLSKASVNS